MYGDVKDDHLRVYRDSAIGVLVSGLVGPRYNIKGSSDFSHRRFMRQNGDRENWSMMEAGIFMITTR